MINLLKEKPIVVNIGLTGFYEDLCEQQAQVVQVSWQPPLDVFDTVDLGEEMDSLLNKIL